MKITTFVAATAIAAATVAATAGTAQAENASTPANPDVASVVNYTAHQDGATDVISIDHGQLVVDHGQFQIRSAKGDVLAGIPLQFNIGDVALPIDAVISGNTARLTPSLDPARAAYHPVALPFQDSAPWKTPYDREQAAFTRMAQTITAGAAGGTVAGAVGGGVIGCLLGGVTGAVATAPLATMFGAGPLAGCLVGATALAPIGAIGGALVVGGPVAIAALIQYQDTINAPFKPAPAPPK
ncbi:hypothetical protein FOS14_08930 [Skermania sp. ID1734]|uniref:hypothetical protein n=1 Tax=Skermania sp. ID1734 TaxID=2597516 RepID=UPI00117DA025|nr:hypothetical protein [Skermania sp. ID1734]TSD99947.1 hypothetical protein FOS14_08930 [Skermania sp. ID1734]